MLTAQLCGKGVVIAQNRLAGAADADGCLCKHGGHIHILLEIGVCAGLLGDAVAPADEHMTLLRHGRKPAGLKALLSYLRTHAYQTDDRRPDTANIPKRAEYTANPSSAVAAPSSSEAASSSEGQSVQYQAAYRVDKNGGGRYLPPSFAVKV